MILINRIIRIGKSNRITFPKVESKIINIHLLPFRHSSTKKTEATTSQHRSEETKSKSLLARTAKANETGERCRIWQTAAAHHHKPIIIFEASEKKRVETETKMQPVPKWHRKFKESTEIEIHCFESKSVDFWAQIDKRQIYYN